VSVNGKNSADVQLVVTNSSLGEVVVVGYGTQRRREVTGAVSRVGSEKLNAIPVPSFEAALQGKAPGVQVIQGNGLAGSGSVIRIRGVGSISASADPLYVIDGIPIVSDPFLRGNSGAMNQNPLSSLNPADIESVEILKDAGATGIYGSRGANGVILITTKRGKTGKPSFSYSNKLGISNAAIKPSFVNGPEWLQLRQEAWVNSGHTGQAPLPGSLTPAQAAANNTDWWDLLTRTGFINDHNLSMNMGTAKLKTFANLTYSNDAGYIKANSYSRVSARLNMDYKPVEILKVSLTTGFNHGLNKRVPAAWDGGIGDAMSSALPIYVPYNANGTYVTSTSNPIRRINETHRREVDNRFLGGLSIELQPIKNLFLKAVGSLELVRAYDDQYETNLWTQKTSPDSGYAKRYPYWGTNWTTTFTANYLWNLGKQHKFNFLVGQENQSVSLKEYTAEIGQWSGIPYWHDVNSNLSYKHLRDKLLRENSMSERQKDAWTFTSFFGRLNYNFKERYFLQLTARVDGSSKFGTNNKYGFFPAASAAWNISDESFLKEIKWISSLKLRASYGIVGNANIKSGVYYDNYQRGGNNYNGTPTLYLNNLGNPDLKWETMKNADAGLEFALMNNRITGEVAYYRKVSSDILLSPGISPSATGLGDIWRNLTNSEILNEGMEFSLNYKLIDKKDLKWSVGGNIARNYNEVLKYELGPDAVSGGTNDTRIVQGYPIGVNYLVRYYGVDPSDGLPIWLDKNGKQTKTFSLDHRVYAVAVLPDYIGGVNTSVEYKNFELSALFTFVIGGNLYENSGKYQFLGVSKKNWNFRKDFLDRWTVPGDDAQYPKLVYDATEYPGVPSEDQFNSTMFLRDADYMRLRELTLSYRFPMTSVAKLKLKGLRLFLTGSNLLTFTKFPGGDPEITRDFENPQDRNLSPNITYLTAPTQRTIVFGLNVNF
jgi:TonB-linked SusC/RagA family outer membrane protein